MQRRGFQFDVPIIQHQAVQFMLARWHKGLRQRGLLVWKAAWLLNQGVRNTKEASIAKTFAADMAMTCDHDAVQIYGGNGIYENASVEKLMRDAKVIQILRRDRPDPKNRHPRHFEEIRRRYISLVSRASRLGVAKKASLLLATLCALLSALAILLEGATARCPGREFLDQGPEAVVLSTSILQWQRRKPVSGIPEKIPMSKQRSGFD